MSQHFLLPFEVKPAFKAELRLMAIDESVTTDTIECWLLNKKAMTGRYPKTTCVTQYRKRVRLEVAAELAAAGPLQGEPPKNDPLLAGLHAIGVCFRVTVEFDMPANRPAASIAVEPPRKAK